MSRAFGANLVRIGAALSALGTLHTVVNAALLRRPRLPAPATPHRVSVLVPARDEQERIAGCVTALRAQHSAGELEILVLDDESTDDTSVAAEHAAGGDPRVRLVSGQPLPSGWLGKPHACAQLAAAAVPSSDVLVFVDADVQLRADAVSGALELLDRAGLDFVSPYPRQLATGAAERLVQPLLQWSWLTLVPLRLAERSHRPSLAIANGQFLAVRRAAYDRAGGHPAVRGDVLDDVALARALRRTGARGGMADGTGLADCRMYVGWPALRDGYAKSLWAAFGTPAAAAAGVALLVVTYVLPPMAALAGSRAGAAGYLAAVAGRMVSAAVTGGRAWPDALAHPVSIGVAGALTARSVVGHRRGTLAWKQRSV